MDFRAAAKRLRRALVPSAIVLAVVIGLIAVWRGGFLVSDNVPFSKLTWALSGEGRRHDMAQDFLDNHFRIGMSVDDVVALLGEPDLEREHWVYFLSDRGRGPRVGTPAELAQYPCLMIRFRAERVDTVFGEESMGVIGVATVPTPAPFAREAWLRGSFDERRAMAWTLAESPPFLGASHDEIANLLGVPDERDARFFEYELGWSTADPRGLVIEFDENDRATTGRVVQH